VLYTRLLVALVENRVKTGTQVRRLLCSPDEISWTRVEMGRGYIIYLKVKLRAVADEI
jgi:hypothetical protein